MSAHPNGGMPARGAVVRWSWRLFRRDWRQHLLIVVLLTASVAAAVGFSCAAYNVAPASGDAAVRRCHTLLPVREQRSGGVAGEARRRRRMVRIDRRDRSSPGAGAGHRAGRSTTDRRTPTGPFGGPMLSLRTGRYPTDDTEAAVTPSVAELVGTEVGSTIDLDGVERTVVGIVENPNDLDDDFVLLAPSELAQSESVAMLVNADDERVNSFRPPGANGRTVSARGDVREDVMAAVLVLVVTTLALFLVAPDRGGQLHRHRPTSAAPARHDVRGRRHREAPSTDHAGERRRHRRRSPRSSARVIGVAGWILIAPRMESAAGYRIDPSNVPWALVAATDAARGRCVDGVRVVAGPNGVADPHRARPVRAPAAAGAVASLGCARGRPARRRRRLSRDRRPRHQRAVDHANSSPCASGSSASPAGSSW